MFLVALLPEMVLFCELTQIPESVETLPELVAINPSRVQPSALRVMALPEPPASTTG